MVYDPLSTETDLATFAYRSSLWIFVLSALLTGMLFSGLYDFGGGEYVAIANAVMFAFFCTFLSAFAWVAALGASWKIKRARILLLLETPLVLFWIYVCGKL